MIEHFDERSFDVDSLVTYKCCGGPILDNLIVRIKIINDSMNE